MIRPAPGFRPLASQILGHEAGTQQEVPELVNAVERICRKLHEQIGPLIGTEGFRVLMVRALHLIKAEHPFFHRVEVSDQSEVCLTGLHHIAQGQEPSELRYGIVAFLANFVWLLATFVGELLALRVVGRAWPDVSLEDEGEGPREVKH